MPRAHRRPGGQVLPHRRAQGRRGLRLPGAAAGLGQLRPHHARRRSGPPPATTAAAAPSTAPCWPATPVAILPEEMSRERFELAQDDRRRGDRHAGLRVQRQGDLRQVLGAPEDRGDDCVIFNQFEEFGNAIWHYQMTGSIIEEIFEQIAGPTDRLAAYVSATGSAGTIAAGDYLQDACFPQLQAWWPPRRCSARRCCSCGFGGHRIEGIGDKHVPWIHNVRNTDMVCAIDDEQCMSLLRLFNEAGGPRICSSARACPRTLVGAAAAAGHLLHLQPASAAIKTAQYYEMDGRDVHLHAADRFDGALRQSRIEEQREQHGPYTRRGGRRALRALPRGHRHRPHARAQLPRPQGAAQLQVLHLGGAAGARRSRSCASSGTPTSGPRPSARSTSGIELIGEFNARTGLV